MWDGREVYANSLDALIRHMEKAFEYNNLYLVELWLSTTLDTLTKIKFYDHQDKTEVKTKLLTILGKITGYEEEKKELKDKVNSVF